MQSASSIFDCWAVGAVNAPWNGRTVVAGEVTRTSVSIGSMEEALNSTVTVEVGTAGGEADDVAQQNFR